MHRADFEPKTCRRKPHIWVDIALACAMSMLLLAACSGGGGASPTPPTPPVYEPTSAAWHPEAGTWQKYQILRGSGTYDPTTGCIDANNDSLVAGEINRNTNLSYLTPKGPAIARVYSPEGVVVTEVPPKLGASLLERVDSAGRYIGEAGSYAGPDLTEPEPMVTLHPVAGETFDVYSTATRWDGVTFPFHSRYRTDAVNVDIDGFKGATITCLVESPEVVATAYTQVYADGELAEQWYGRVEPDNTVNLIFARRVEQGRNP